MFHWLLVCATLLVTPPTLGQPGRPSIDPEILFQRALNAYRYGDYRQTITLLNGLLTPKVLLQNSENVKEALKILGVASHLDGDLQTSREAFMRLLNVDPNHQLDPLIIPPQVVEFFEEVKREMERTLSELRRRQEWERREAERRAIENAPIRLIREEITLDRHPYLMNFMPLGVSQFELGRDRWGWFFFGTQLTALALNVGAASMVELTRNPNGTHSGAELDRARDLYQPMQIASILAFAVLVGWGIADALIAWRPEDRSTRRVEAELPGSSRTEPAALPEPAAPMPGTSPDPLRPISPPPTAEGGP